MSSFREEAVAPLNAQSDGVFLPSFTDNPTFIAGYIDSGPPDYIKVTLQAIYLEGPGQSALVWEGEKEILLDGSDVGLAELNSELGQIPVGAYSGMNLDLGHGGVNPDDPTDKAYFFAHSVFGDSIGIFLGDAGQVEGYQAIYVNYDDQIGDGTQAGVEAWMTLVFDANGDFLSGHLIGDDDNALTVAKGQISTYTVNADGLVDFTDVLNHNLTVYNLYGFERQNNIGDRSLTAEYDSDNQAGGFEGLGEAEFILKHVQ